MLLCATGSPDGRRVFVSDGDDRRATVDARTFAVSEPGSASARPAPPATPRRTLALPAEGEDFPWLPLLLAGGATGLCVIAVVVARRRGKGTSPAPQG